MTAIEINNLNKKIEEFNLQNINLTIPKGKITGLIGQNGAGKTTIIKLITNMLEADSGNISILDSKIDKNNIEMLNTIYLITDKDMLINDFKPLDYDSIMKNIYYNWNTRTFKYYLQRLNLPLNKKIVTYSEIMKVKLNFAIALTIQPELLILDEVICGLDPLTRENMLKTLLSYVKDGEKTVLISSNILSGLDKMLDKIIFINEGKIILEKNGTMLLEQ